MDANQQRFWMLANATDWPKSDRDHSIEYDPDCRRLRLRDRRPRLALAGSVDALASELLLQTPARALDSFGTMAFWDPVSGTLQATGGLDPQTAPVTLWVAPPLTSVIDLAMGFDDVLYVALQRKNAVGDRVRSAVGMFDPRGRWRLPILFQLELDGFAVDRLAAHPEGGAWLLDRTRPALGRVRGLPLRDGLPPTFSPTTFRPDPENPNTPRFEIESDQPHWTEPAQQNPIALASSPAGNLAVMTQTPDGETWLHLQGTDGRWHPSRRLTGSGQPGSVAWYSEKRIVVLPATRSVNSEARLPREAIAYDPGDESRDLEPAGTFLPVRDLAEAQFLKGVNLPPHYPVPGNRERSLRPLSLLSFERTGTALGRVLDSGQPGTVWHRLYLEAVCPPGCSAILDLAASDDAEHVPGETDWHRHEFGELPTEGNSAEPLSAWERPARGVRLRENSEIPNHPGLLGTTRRTRHSGLFTALVQRSGQRVRRLAGRYLRMRVRLVGTGDRTPEIAAARIYGSRFSYRDAYLAELYQEELFGKDADARDRATDSDFLERFLLLFESLLTPLEDRVTAAHAVTVPCSTPDEALDWLGNWIGVVFSKSFPADRRRAWLEAAPRLFRTRGTLAGMNLALEIATGGRLQRAFVDRNKLRSDGRSVLPAPDSDPELLLEHTFPVGGGVTGGEIVVLEGYRLRRTFATILGTHLSESNDPLLPGLIVSANSRLGETLFLGESEKEELLALFRDAFSSDTNQRAREKASVRTFHGRLAHRVTVFVHDQVTPIDFALVRRIAEQEAPAHVELQVIRASYPLLVGLASLVDVDTYLGPGQTPGNVKVDSSRLGERDYIRGKPSLDPRLGGTPWPTGLPVARIRGPRDVGLANPEFTLDGSTSTSAPGGVVDRYVWTLRERESRP